MTSESPLQLAEEIEQGKFDKDRPCDWCGTDENVRSVRDPLTHEADVSICDACVLSGVWRTEVEGASQTVLLAYAGVLALRD